MRKQEQDPGEKVGMQGSYLIQRLNQPRIPKGDTTLEKVWADNPFSFGGGLRNGGLSPEAMDLLRKIWSFDYTGAAEFEFGAVPTALQTIAKSTKLVAFEVEVATDDVRDVFPKDVKSGIVKGTVYGICPEAWVDVVKQRIADWAYAEYNGKRRFDRTKESIGLERALRKPDDPYGACGWLEIDNGFLFFLDKEMFEKAAALFEIKV